MVVVVVEPGLADGHEPRAEPERIRGQVEGVDTVLHPLGTALPEPFGDSLQARVAHRVEVQGNDTERMVAVLPSKLTGSLSRTSRAVTSSPG